MAKVSIEQLTTQFTELVNIQAMFIEQSKQLQKIPTKKTNDGKELKTTVENTKKLTENTTKLTTAEREILKVTKEIEKERIKLAKVETKRQKQQRELIALATKEGKSIEKLNAANKILKNRLREVDQETEKGRKRAEAYRKVIDRNTTSIRKLTENTTKLTTAEREILKVTKEIEKERIKLAKVETKVQKQRRDLIAASKLEVKSEDDLIKRTNALVKLRRLASKTTKEGRAEIKRMTAEIKKNSAALKKSNAAIGRANRSVGSYAKSVMTAALRMGAMYLGFQSLISVIKNVVGITVTYEKAQSKLASILGTTSNRIKDLSNDNLRLGASTKFTAKEVTGLQTELAKLGFDRGEILKSTESILSLAAATGTDLSEAAILTGATLRSFNLDASKATSVTDTLAKSTSISSLDMQKLAEALPIVGATADNAGVSLERTVAILGKITDRGVNATTAGTALRNIFLELSKQGLTWDEAMKKIQTSTDKNKTAMELFGKRGATVASIVSGLTTEIGNMETALQGAAGTADEMAREQLDNLAGKTAILKSAWEGFVLSLDSGNGALSKFLKSVVTGTTKLLNMATATEDNVASLMDEQTELFKMRTELELATTSESDRLKIINDLKTTYPGYLKNIDAEKVSNQELQVELLKVNESLLDKLLLAKSDEKYIKQKIKVENEENEVAEKKASLINTMAKASAKYNITQIEGNTITKRAENLIDQINEGRKSGARITGTLRNEITNLIDSEADLNMSETKLLMLGWDREKLIKTLNLVMGKQTDATKKLKKAENITIDEEELQKKLFEVRKKYGLLTQQELFDKAVEKFENSEEAKYLSAEEKEKVIYEIRKKYFIKELALIAAKSDAQNKTADELAEMNVERALTEWEAKINAVKEQSEAQNTIYDELANANVERAWNEAQELIKIAQDKEATKQEIAQASIQLIGTLSDNKFQYEQNLRDKEQEAEIQKLTALNLSEEEFEKRKSIITKKYAKEDQKAAVKQALINTALAVGNALATVKPFVPAALVAAGLAAVLGGIQVGSIKKQEFAEGEVDINGKSHKQGGINANIEGGESVINKRATSGHKGLLTAVNSDLSDAEIFNAMLTDMNQPLTANNFKDDRLLIEMQKNNKHTKRLIELEENRPQYIPTSKGLKIITKGKEYTIRG